MTKKTPQTLRLGTWNALRDRRDPVARGNLEAILRDFDLHALALQEARDYLDVLGRIDGFRPFIIRDRGADQQPWLVREDVRASHKRAVPLGGDGWTTVDGHHHIASVAVAITLADWLRAVNLHLPPSIDWPGGQPAGPKERVDDYIANMKTLRRYAKRRPGARGLLYVGDWNNRPGRDDGAYSARWLAREAGMTIGKAPNASGGLHGIDFPMVDRDTRLTEVRQRDRYGSDHPLVTFKATRVARDR